MVSLVPEWRLCVMGRQRMRSVRRLVRIGLVGLGCWTELRSLATVMVEVGVSRLSLVVAMVVVRPVLAVPSRVSV